MKTAVAFPFLFGSYIILNLIISNLDQLDPSQSLRPLVVLILGTGIAILLLWAVFRDWHYSAYLSLLFLVFLFVPAHFYRLILPRFPIPAETVRLGLMMLFGAGLVLLGLHKVWLGMGGAQKVTPFLNATFAIALLSQTIVAGPQLIDYLESLRNRQAEVKLPRAGSPIQLDCTRRPDIYYIVLDGYGRNDVLDQIYGVDNTGFLEALESKGFFVARQTHANYIQTIFSLSSSLNFSYIGPEPRGLSGREYFTRKISDNRIMQLLETCGYQTITFDTGFFFTNHVEADMHLSDSPPLKEFESLLLADTPLDAVAERLNQKPAALSYEAHRSRVLYQLEELKRIPRQPGPKFVFVHILSPHPPFVFGADGSFVEPGRSYSTADGDDYSGSREEYRKGYAAQVQFINRQMVEVVDAILDRSATPPIVIIQGDHGPGSELDWDSPDQTCLWERTSILNAYYLPDQGVDELDASISPVNTFRVILNNYFGTNLELLPDRTFFTSQRLPRRVIEITGERARCERSTGGLWDLVSSR